MILQTKLYDTWKSKYLKGLPQRWMSCLICTLITFAFFKNLSSFNLEKVLQTFWLAFQKWYSKKLLIWTNKMEIGMKKLLYYTFCLLGKTCKCFHIYQRSICCPSIVAYLILFFSDFYSTFFKKLLNILVNPAARKRQSQ